jgi:hypothetical protein
MEVSVVKNKIRLFIENEIRENEEIIKKSVDEMQAFWDDRKNSELVISANYPAPLDIPAPVDCSVTERELYYQIIRYMRPALESRVKSGVIGMPMIYPHDSYYTGPHFGTHFLAAVLGAEITFPQDTEKIGWYSWAQPIINDRSQFEWLANIDVSKSPVLQAVNRALEETSEIVRGRIPITNYSPTFVLDFAAEVIGHIKFYEMAAEAPDDAYRLLDICTDKWIEMMDLQQKAAGVKLAGYLLMPGTRISDMILSFFSPEIIRKVVLPYNKKMSEHYGGCVIEIDHCDPSLMDDYMKLPGIRGISVPITWPSDGINKKASSEYAYMGHFSYHYHKGLKPHAPICVSWEDCCRRVSEMSGKRRFLASLYCDGKTYDDRLNNLLRDIDDVRAAWDKPADE